MSPAHHPEKTFSEQQFLSHSSRCLTVQYLHMHYMTEQVNGQKLFPEQPRESSMFWL